MFALTATFSDGHSVTLDERYDARFRADRAAQNYIRDFSDPCGLGVHVSYVTVRETFDLSEDDGDAIGQMMGANR